MSQNSNDTFISSLDDIDSMTPSDKTPVDAHKRRMEAEKAEQKLTEQAEHGAKVKSKITSTGSKCRDKAIQDVHQYQYDNASKKQIKNDKVDQVAVSIKELAKIMLKDYYWARTPSNVTGASQLMFYDDMSKSNVRGYKSRGLYFMSNVNIEHELANIYSDYTVRHTADIINHIGSRVSREQGDMPGYLVPVNNGIFNLKTKKLMSFSPKYIFTSKIATDYPDKKPADPKIEISERRYWSVDKFIKTALPKDQIKTFWQVAQEWLNSNFTHGKMVLLQGTQHGGNGKSFLCDLFEHTIGTGGYTTVDISQLGDTFGCASLPGKTCIITDDIDGKTYITGEALSVIRSITTGQGIQINQKNMPTFTYKFRGLVVVGCNGDFKVSDIAGLKRRGLILVMKHRFHNHPQLLGKIFGNQKNCKRVCEYILWKALNEPMFDHYTTSAVGDKAINGFIKKSNHVLEFAHNVFAPEKIDVIPKMTAYDFYQAWAKRNNYSTHMSSHEFLNQFSNSIGDAYTTKRERITTNIEGDMTRFMSDADLKVDYPTDNSRKRCFVRTVGTISDSDNDKDREQVEMDSHTKHSYKILSTDTATSYADDKIAKIDGGLIMEVMPYLFNAKQWATFNDEPLSEAKEFIKSTRNDRNHVVKQQKELAKSKASHKALF